MINAQLFQGLDYSHSWLICESRLQSQNLASQLKEQFSIQSPQIFSADEASARLVRVLVEQISDAQILPQNFSILSFEQSLVLLTELITDNSKQFPILNQQLGNVASVPYPEVTSEIKRYIDTVRAHQSTEGFIKNIIDEQGEVKLDKNYQAELQLLSDSYLVYQLENNSYDQLGILEIVTDQMRWDRILRQKISLPILKQLVLVQPSYLYPLQIDFWKNISQLCPLTILTENFVTDEEVQQRLTMPSSQYLSQVAKFINEADGEKISVKTFSEKRLSRDALCKDLFDAEFLTEGEVTTEIISGINVLKFKERRDEVREVSDLIKSLIEKGESPDEIAVIPLDYQAYLGILVNELEKRDISVSLKEGKPLRTTGTAGLLKDLLHWIEQPTAELMLKIFSSELLKKEKITEEKTEKFIKKYQKALTNNFSLENKNSEESFDPYPIYKQIKRLGLGNVFPNDPSTLCLVVLKYYQRIYSARDSVHPQEFKKVGEEFTNFCLNFSCLEEELEKAETLRNIHQPDQLTKQLRRYFHQIRKTKKQLELSREGRVGELNKNLLDKELLEFVSSYRALRRSFVSSLNLLKKTNPVGKQGFNLAKNSLTEFVDKTFLQNPYIEKSVIISDLTECSGLTRKHCFVLGVSSKSFPYQEEDSYLYGSPLDWITSRIGERSGKVRKVFQSFYLVSYLLRHIEHLTFSYSESSVGEESSPANFILELRKKIKSVSGAKQTKKNEFQNIELTEHGKSLAPLLKARNSGDFTEYDGLLSSEKAKIQEHPIFKCSKKSPEAEKVSHYNITALEELADCRHRYFFKHILELKPERDSILDEVNRQVGEVVHKALQDYFDPKQNKDLDFDSSCLKILKIANQLFSESSVDWESHPLLQNAKERIIAGLDQPGDSSKRGFLKAALVFQRDYIKSLPLELEKSFGCTERNSKNIPLFLENSETSQKIHISGKIDRIDSLNNHGIPGLAVWDYKTGNISKVSELETGKSLQVPLYGAYLRNDPEFFETPLERGGYIALKEPNRRDADLESPTRGAVVEHLAISEGYRKSLLTEPEEIIETVERKIEQAKNKVFELDSFVRAGKFNQQIDTEACRYCEFSKICYRDQAVLQQMVSEKIENGICPITDFEETADDNFLEYRDIQLSQEQELATDINKNISLIAGAGSGKTAVLRTRVLKFVLEGIPITSILAVTFTEKAAREIKERIVSAITGAVAENKFNGKVLSEIERMRLISAATQIDLAQFGTIHSLASKIIQMSGNLSSMNGYRKVLSGAEQHELIRECLESVLVENSKLTKELLDKGISYGLLVEELKRLVLSRRNLEELSKGIIFKSENLQKEFLEKILSSLVINQTKTLQPFLSEWIEATENWLDSPETSKILKPEQKEDFLSLLNQTKTLLPFCDPQLTWERNDIQNFIKEVSQVVSFISEHQSSAKRKSAKNNPRNLWNELRDQLVNIDLELLGNDLELDLQSLKDVQGILKLAQELNKKYAEKKSQAELVDFEDLIIEANRLVNLGDDKNSFGLISRLQERFQHLLVDEFQDTDSLQWNIIKSIHGERGESSLFIVGDKQQAIYGFREGDVRVFNSATEYILSHGGISLSLKDNYRSHPRVVDFVNNFFGKLFSADFNQPDGTPLIPTAVSSEQMVSKKKTTIASEENIIFLSNDLETEDKEENEETPLAKEARNVAEHIRKVLEEVRNPKSENWKLLRENSSNVKIAVLTRTVRQLTLMAETLQLYKIPFSISHSSGFFDLEEIVQIENLLKALSGNHDQISLVGALRSSLFGLSDADLLSLRLELNDNWAEKLWQEELLKDKSDKAQVISQYLRRWRSFSANLGTSDLLELIVEDLQLADVFCEAEQTDAYRNIERLIDCLRKAEFENQIGINIRDALLWIEQQRGDSTSSPNANNSGHPVVLTTIHGAKGLEYPMVILPFLDSIRRKDYDFLMGEISGEKVLAVKSESEVNDFRRQKTLLLDALRKEENSKLCSEERRVFYVACTRAVDYLVLSLNKTKSGEKILTEFQEFSSAEKQKKIAKSDRPGIWLRCLGSNLTAIS